MEVHPHVFDLDVGFVHTPGIGRRLETRTAVLLQFRCVALDPAVDLGITGSNFVKKYIGCYAYLVE